MTRTTQGPSRALKLIVIGSTLAASAVYANAASAAAAPAPTLSKATPAAVASSQAVTFTLTGKNLPSTLDTAVFAAAEVPTYNSAATTYCKSNQVVVTSPTTAIVRLGGDTNLANCTAGQTKVSLFNASGSGSSTAVKVVLSPDTKGKGGVTFIDPHVLATNAVTTARPLDGGQTVPFGVVTGGTPATVTVTTEIPATATVIVALDGKAMTKTKVSEDGLSITGLTPPGSAGLADLRIAVGGILSATREDAFEYRSTVKVSPNTWVSGAEAPLVKIDGLGFKPTIAEGATRVDPSVTVCGVAATLSTAKAYTDKTLYVTPPTLAAVDAAITDSQVSVAQGGVCPVKVTYKENGTSGADVTSVYSATSTFAYVAF